jgi:hypothetical protein
MTINAEQRRALRLLAGSPPGVTEAMMLAHGFTNEMLARLIIDGLATVAPESIRASGRRVEIARLKITDSGPAGADRAGAMKSPAPNWMVIRT